MMWEYNITEQIRFVLLIIFFLFTILQVPVIKSILQHKLNCAENAVMITPELYKPERFKPELYNHVASKQQHMF